MTPITSVIDIDSTPGDVFPYVIDPSRFGEWQAGVVSGCVEGEGPAAPGSLCTMTRRIAGANRTSTSRVTEISPPRTWAIHGIDGPIRADVSVTVDPIGEGDRSRVTIEIAFHGHGIGTALVPMVARQARKEMPRNLQNLKRQLEQGAGTG